MMNTLPLENFVEADERRGMSRSTPAPISPASGRAGPPRGMPISTTSTSPAYALPGRTQTPIFGRWNATVATQCTAGPATSPVDASTPDGMSAAITGARAASISSITRAAGSRGTPEEPGAEQRVDDHVRLVEPPRLERDRRAPGQLLELRLRVLAHPLGRPHGVDLDLAARPGAAAARRRSRHRRCCPCRRRSRSARRARAARPRRRALRPRAPSARRRRPSSR